MSIVRQATLITNYTSNRFCVYREREREREGLKMTFFVQVAVSPAGYSVKSVIDPKTAKMTTVCVKKCHFILYNNSVSS